MVYPFHLETPVRDRRIEAELLHDPFIAPEPVLDTGPTVSTEEHVEYLWEEDFDFDVGVGD